MGTKVICLRRRAIGWVVQELKSFIYLVDQLESCGENTLPDFRNPVFLTIISLFPSAFVGNSVCIMVACEALASECVLDM